MISVRDVSKSFGKVQALKRVSFDVSRGGVVGLLGPNGAGKTTMMRLITGFFPPTDGSVLIDDVNLLEAKPSIRKKVGYLAENNPLYRDMTAREFLNHVVALKSVPRGKRKHALEVVIEQCGISSVLDRMVGKLSKGFQQRIGLAQALIGDPEFLILDEPTSGLDPKQIIEIRNLICSLGSDRTVMLSTHILSEVRMTCQTLLILNEGRLVAQGSVDELENRLNKSREYQVTIRGVWEQGDEFLKDISGVISVRVERENGAERDYRVVSEQDKDIRSEIAQHVIKAGHELLALKAADWGLEDAFLKIVSNEQGESITCSS